MPDPDASHERLARIPYPDRIMPLTVFASDGDMVAFKYDDGGYGWAPRKSFVTLHEAECAAAAMKEQRERLRADENLRAVLRIEKDIRRVQGDLCRLFDLRAHYNAKEAHRA